LKELIPVHAKCAKNSAKNRKAGLYFFAVLCVGFRFVPMPIGMNLHLCNVQKVSGPPDKYPQRLYFISIQSCLPQQFVLNPAIH
jgi:hypothetical protein